MLLEADVKKFLDEHKDLFFRNIDQSETAFTDPGMSEFAFV